MGHMAPSVTVSNRVCMLWFNFILGLNSILFCFKPIIITYHTQTRKKIKFKPSLKLNPNTYITNNEVGQLTISLVFKYTPAFQGCVR